MPSGGCRKNAGVPVLAIVAAIFCPTRPDFPIPDTTTLPLQRSNRSTALPHWLSNRSTSDCTARASILSTRRPAARLPPLARSEDPDDPLAVTFVDLPRRISASPVRAEISIDGAQPYWARRRVPRPDWDGLP